MSENDRRWGRRCDLGCESWPDHNDYGVCAVCGEETTRYSNLLPISDEDAEILKRQLDFEAYYENYCDRVSRPADGPLEPTHKQHEKYDALYPGGRPDRPSGTKPDKRK